MSSLKRDIQRSINPHRHANDGGCKSSSPGSACTSGEDDSCTCIVQACLRPAPPVWHNLSPDPITLSSMQRSQSTPSPYNSIHTKLNLMNYAALSLRILIGSEHTGPAYNHIPSGGEEHNE